MGSNPTAATNFFLINELAVNSILNMEFNDALDSKRVDHKTIFLLYYNDSTVDIIAFTSATSHMAGGGGSMRHFL